MKLGKFNEMRRQLTSHFSLWLSFLIRIYSVLFNITPFCQANAIQRIERGKRFVTDIELKAFAEIFNVSLENLI